MDMFMVILRGVRDYDPYFECKSDATSALGFTSYKKMFHNYSHAIVWNDYRYIL
jgi:hypothetical protein